MICESCREAAAKVCYELACPDAYQVPPRNGAWRAAPGSEFYDKAAQAIRSLPARSGREELLREFLDLVPRMSDDDPIAPALAELCKRTKAALSEGSHD